MAVDRVQCERDILVHAVALGTVLILPPDHGALDGVAFHHGDAALVAAGVPAVGVQRPGGVRLVDPAVGIVRHHGVGRLGADAVGFRHEHRLVVIAGQSRGLVLLDERTLAAALAAGADLQRLGRVLVLHDEGLVVAAHAVVGRDGRSHVQRPGVSRVLTMVLIDRRGYLARTDGGRPLLLVTDGAALRGMLGVEAGRIHHAGSVAVCLGAEGSRDFMGNLHADAALVVQADAACRSSASRSTSGSSLPRAEALRRIP